MLHKCGGAADVSCQAWWCCCCWLLWILPTDAPLNSEAFSIDRNGEDEVDMVHAEETERAFLGKVKLQLSTVDYGEAPAENVGGKCLKGRKQVFEEGKMFSIQVFPRQSWGVGFEAAILMPQIHGQLHHHPE